MSDCIIVRRGGRGGGSVIDPFAVLEVTYPAGSICSATNGSLTLFAPDTTGECVFYIPYKGEFPQTWTISCHDNSSPPLTCERTVTVLAFDPQTEELKLSYRIPSEYQEVEYLIGGSGGTRYIVDYSSVLGLNEITAIEADVDVTDMSTASTFLQIMPEIIYDNGSGGIGAIATSVDANGTNLRFSCTSSSQTYSEKVYTATRTIFRVEVNRGTRTATLAYTNNSYVPPLPVEHTITSISFDSYKKMNKVGYVSSFLTKVYLHEVNVYGRNGEHIGNLIPCRRLSDSHVGVYDSITETYTDMNTFRAGPDV